MPMALKPLTAQHIIQKYQVLMWTGCTGAALRRVIKEMKSAL